MYKIYILSIPIRIKNLLHILIYYKKIHLKWSSVGYIYKQLYYCLSAIRFRGGVILQVSFYTLLMRIPTSMATVLLSTPHGTPFRVYRKVGADKIKPNLSWERQVESLITSSAYQKWPTTNLLYNINLRI